MNEPNAGSDAPRPQWRRELLFRAVLLVAGIGFALLVAEVALRLGVVSTEPLRIRRAIGAAGERPRVLILGDSFSVDYRNERPDLDYGETATLQLRGWLEGRGVHVLNLAQRATGPADYLERFARYGVRYRPDLVLLNYYVGNDLVDANRRPPPTLRHRLAALARRHTYLGHAWRDVRRWMQTDDYETLAQETNLLNTVLLDLGRRQPRQYLDSLLVDTPAARAAWERNEKTLLRIARMCPPGARLVINVFPAAVQVDDSHFEFLRELGFELEEVFLETRVPQDLMLDFCRRSGLTCHDFLDAFRARAADELYLERDTHWNAAGNALAFERLKAITGAQLSAANAG